MHNIINIDLNIMCISRIDLTNITKRHSSDERLGATSSLTSSGNSGSSCKAKARFVSGPASLQTSKMTSKNLEHVEKMQEKPPFSRRVTSFGSQIPIKSL